MKISAQEEYGLRCLLQLARAEAVGESLTLAQIAEREGISVANAGKLMWILNKAGLVQSQRGTKGGYHLARPASEIHLNEVIRVLDDEHGRIALRELRRRARRVRPHRRLRHPAGDRRAAPDCRQRAVGDHACRSCSAPKRTSMRRCTRFRDCKAQTGEPIARSLRRID